MDETIAVRLRVPDQAIADDLLVWASDEDDIHLEQEEMRGVLPVVGAVIAGTIAAAALTKLILHIRGSFACQQIIDFRGDEIRQITNCEHRNGRIIVAAKDKEQVTIHDVPDIIDLTAIAKQATTEGANLARAAIEAAGGTADVEKQDEEAGETEILSFDA